MIYYESKPGVYVHDPLTIQAAQLPAASTTYTFAITNLNRNAKARRVICGGPVNATHTPFDESVNISVGVLDSLNYEVFSTLTDVSSTLGVRDQTFHVLTAQTLGASNASYFIYFDSTGREDPKSHWLAGVEDTLEIQIVTPSTAITTGEMPIYVVEIV